jgi:hypothetical protein
VWLLLQVHVAAAAVVGVEGPDLLTLGNEVVTVTECVTM